ncbi:MAG: 1-deoxy-D-xylulose-5-phosphate synthase, partial [Bacilli bacterium]|nr:1-deoxy-D-xylulose-5-phosphate synthase [Bacilli bacterium]
MKKKILKHINLSEIKSPDFLKELNYKELDLLSKDIAEYIIDVTSKNGGHLSSNLGVVDATIALCRAFDFSKDKIVFDVGHQCYTYKILTGRSLERLRQKDGVSGFQKIAESPYDHFECGHSSTSISVVNGLATARDMNGEKYHTIAFIGDSSIVNGLALEGLNITAQSGHKSIIILNDNDMSISKPVGGLATSFRKFSTSTFYRKSKNRFKRFMALTGVGRKMLNGFSRIKNWFKRKLLAITAFDNLGYAMIGPVDGHNIKMLERAFERAKDQDKSVIVVIKTIKGKGYKYAEADKTGEWHGVGKF